MDWDRDRKLDVAGIVLVVVVLLSIGLLAVGTAQIEPGPSAGQPDVEWSVERINDSHARIVHDGGDTMYASELFVTADGRQLHVDFEGAIRPGDETVVRASPGTQVRLHWTGADGEPELMGGERV